MWKMEPAQVLADHHWMEEAHRLRPVLCFKICHSDESRSFTGLTQTSRCRPNPCPGTHPSLAKGNNLIFIYYPELTPRTISDISTPLISFLSRKSIFSPIKKYMLFDLLYLLYLFSSKH